MISEYVCVCIVGGNDMKMMTIDENVNEKKMFLWIFITSKMNIPQNRWNYLKYYFLLS